MPHGAFQIQTNFDDKIILVEKREEVSQMRK